MGELQKTVSTVIMVLSQQQLLLESCPQNNDSLLCDLNDPTCKTDSTLTTAVQGDPVWQEVAGTVADILHQAFKMAHVLHRHGGISAGLKTWKDVQFVEENFSKLENICVQLQAAASRCRQDCLSQGIHFCIQKITHACQEFRSSCNMLLDRCNEGSGLPSVESDSRSRSLHHLALRVVKRVLLSVQSTVRLTETMDAGIWVEAHLTSGLIALLDKMFEKLQLKKLETLLHRFICKLTSDEVFGFARVAVSLFPIVHQFNGLLHFWLTLYTAAHRTSVKLLYILLKVFLQLAEKGFCLPAELEKELQQEGEMTFEDIQSGGLGEGEGIKDVSKQIESEDQLEDARQEGQEDKKGDDSDQANIKDEDNGIEVSDDFEGKAYDPDREDASDKDSTEGEEDDELDKKMGKVGKDGEKLDEQLWGSDEDDETDLKDEDGGRGGCEQLEPHLLAKQDDQQSTENDDECHTDQTEEYNLEDNCLQDDEEYPGEKCDPYKNAKSPVQEPQPMDLPEQMDLDLDSASENGAKEDTDEVDNNEREMAKEDDDKEIDDEEEIGNEEMAENGDEERPEDGKENADASLDQDMGEGMGKEATEDLERDDPEENEAEAPPSADKNVIAEACQGDISNKDGSADKVYAAPQVPEHQVSLQQSAQQDDQPQVGELQGEQQSQGQTGSALSQDSISILTESQQTKPKQSGEKRSLARNRDTAKRLPTIENRSDPKYEPNHPRDLEGLYEHVTDQDGHDAQTLDVATEEQAEVCSPASLPHDTEPLLEEPEEEPVSSRTETSLKFNGTAKKFDVKSSNNKVHKDSEEESATAEVLGEVKATQGARRPPDSSIHTQHDIWASSLSDPTTSELLRQQLEEQLGTWNRNSVDNISAERQEETCRMWQLCERVVAPLVQELCEQLRLVLEPTKTAKLKGDYRTGKRLNMRKVIPYIASQFQKDKIWLRRTKPSKRTYQIMIALDDSSSMADNALRQLAFESLALLGQALTLLEAGELGIVSFGEDVTLLHPFGEPFTNQAGAKLMGRFTFSQRRTAVAQLLKYAAEIMMSHRSLSRTATRETAQLLVIISDGRGLFNEGEDIVRKAVRHMRQQNIFVVFIVLDNPENKDSILDIRVPVFKGPGQVLEIQSYMENFPFPFYIILRDTSAMPLILGQALRQWFELVSSTDR